MKAEQTITHLRKRVRLAMQYICHVEYLNVNIKSKNLGREPENMKTCEFRT
jgi:hypothetical protein